ncbi:MAG: Tim44/TimA family putative adaptor protein [Kiloniellales bacterium]|nr:Tim44/TimA family putative adaptor protein [Kiloniellales bacterium]
MQFFEIILFAALAAFLVLQLRRVLGRRTGHEQPRDFDPFQQRSPEDSGNDKVVNLPDRRSGRREGEAPAAANGAAEDPLAGGLTQIKLADHGFDESSFVEGARAAFEMIVAAFADGDSKTLRPLLSNSVFDDFTGAIRERESAQQTLETTLVGIKEAKIEDAELQDRTAFVTLRFVSEQINVVKDSEGRIVEGDPSDVTQITDLWTFARNTRSRDPNWTLVATRSPD